MNIYLPLLLLVVVAFCEAGFASENEFSLYKGIKVPPVPPGYEEMSGYVVNPDAAVEYVVMEIWSEKHRMWWLERLLNRDTKGKPTFVVVAVMAVPEIPKGYSFVKGFCKKNGVRVPEIIAATKYNEDQRELTEIHSVWYVDTTNEMFKPYQKNGVTCVNMSYGT